MSEIERERLRLLEVYVATQYAAIMNEGGGEVAEKIEGLFKARDTMLARILNEEASKE